MSRDRYRAGKRLWSAADDRRLRRLFPGMPTATLAAQLRRTYSSVCQRARKLGLKKSAAYLASPAACRLRRGDHVGAAFRFKPGQTPANKGLRRPGWAPGRMAETQFRAGERRGKAARNWRPIGTVLTDFDGYLRIKVREASRGEATGFGNTRVWPLLHRHVWEQAHGAVPPGHAVVFKDRNRANCALENLELITRAALMARNTIHNLPAPVKQAVQLLGRLNRQIRKRTAHATQEQDRGSA